MYDNSVTWVGVGVTGVGARLGVGVGAGVEIFFHGVGVGYFTISGKLHTPGINDHICFYINNYIFIMTSKVVSRLL